MLSPPQSNAALLPVGLVAPGRDHNLYVVEDYPLPKHWKLWHAASLKHVPSENVVEYILHDIPELPDIKQTDQDCNKANVDIEPPQDTPRRGRPKKVQDKPKRVSRPPTEYNIFMKTQMENLKDVSDTRTKMKIIARLWKESKEKLNHINYMDVPQ